jgi:L-aminopeptidase/D-esterase-like protein
MSTRIIDRNQQLAVPSRQRNTLYVTAAQPVLTCCECQRVAQECRLIIARVIADCTLTAKDSQSTLALVQQMDWHGTAAQYAHQELLSIQRSLQTIAENAQTLGRRPDVRAL